MKLAVTGGTGFVGQAVLAEAQRRGLVVRALTRRDQPARDQLEWVRGDLHDMQALTDLVHGADAVVHIAGVVNAIDAAGFLHGNVEGSENLLSAARTGGERRLVHVSSLAAREPDLSDYGRSKQLAEEKVKASGLDWTIVRPPAIYGPRDTEMFELFRSARWGVVPLPGKGRTSVIHVDDLARLLLDLAQQAPVASERIFEPDDGAPDGWDQRALARAIGASVGRKVLTPTVPAPLLHMAARLDRMLRGGRAKLTPDRARYFSHPDWVCTAERSVPDNLWRPRIETRDGLLSTAQWYREAGWL